MIGIKARSGAGASCEAGRSGAVKRRANILPAIRSGLFVAGVLAAVLTSASVALADQEVNVKPDGVFHGFVSESEQTRITLRGDRVRRIQAPPNGYDVENDEKTGDVYLIPLPVEKSDKPVATFIITEKGHTVQLRLTPKKKPAEQIIITVDDGAAPVPVANRTARNAPYVDEIVSFVGFVIRGEQPNGVDVRRSLNLPFQKGRVIEATWEGAKLRADVIRVSASDAPVSLSEAQFLESGVAAIWISDRALQAGETARVIVVRLKG